MIFKLFLIKYMMKRAIYTILVCLLTGNLLLTSCSDDNPYMPGEPVPASCQQVYFPLENETQAVLPASDSSQRSISLTVSRQKFESETTIPIKVISEMEEITIPETVTFAAGSNTTELMITISDQAQAGDTYTYQIELEGENIDPYAKLPGNVRFFGSITIIDLIQATASLDSGQGGNFTLNIEKLPDNNYRIADFFKSGHALNFAVNPETGDMTITCDFGYQSGVYWYFYDKNAGAYLPFKNIFTHIQGIYNSAGYTYWKDNEKKAQFYLSGAKYEDGTGNDWETLVLTW